MNHGEAIQESYDTGQGCMRTHLKCKAWYVLYTQCNRYEQVLDSHSQDTTAVHATAYVDGEIFP